MYTTYWAPMPIHCINDDGPKSPARALGPLATSIKLRKDSRSSPQSLCWSKHQPWVARAPPSKIQPNHRPWVSNEYIEYMVGTWDVKRAIWRTNAVIWCDMMWYIHGWAIRGVICQQPGRPRYNLQCEQLRILLVKTSWHSPFWGTVLIKPCQRSMWCFRCLYHPISTHASSIYLSGMGRRRILCPVLLQGAFAMFWNVWHLGANPLHSFPQLLVPKFSVFGLGDQRLTASATFWHHVFRFSLLIYLSIYLSICLSIYPSIYLSIYLSIYPPIRFFGSPRYRQQDIARHHFGCFIQLFHGRRDLGVEGGVDFHLRLRNISERYMAMDQYL